MALFSKLKVGGFADEIRCDEPSYLIWKWHPRDSQLGNNDRENAIRWGSALRVKDGEVAVFVYKQKDGNMQDYIIGPFDGIIKTDNFPVLASIIGLAYDGGTPFQAEVYFINLAKIIQVKFGVPFFDVYDPRFPDFGVPVAVRGTISFYIKDYREFINLHRLNLFDLVDFQKQIRDAINRYVKDTITNAPVVNNIPVVQLETKISQINDAVEYDIALRMREDFGVEITGVDIGAIEVDKTSEGYRDLMAVTKNIATMRVQAEAEDYVENLRIHREEGQYAMHKQTQSANINAFSIERQTEVGIAGSEALGHMGTTGVGNVNLDGNTSGFNPAAVMAGITLGGAVGKNIADSMRDSMSGEIKQSPQACVTPPPIPSDFYYIVENGQASGPHSFDVIKQMVVTGKLNADSLVWKNGMVNWMKARTMEELQQLFPDVPPIPKEY